jgi:transcription initiation factor IIE alpha subunit
MDQAVSALLTRRAVPSDTCPLCGTSVSLLRARERRTEAEMLRKRVATLRARIEDLESGKITSRHLKQEVLWLCPDCQRIMTDLPRLDTQELQQRIHARLRQLERKLANLTRRAG